MFNVYDFILPVYKNANGGKQQKQQSNQFISEYDSRNEAQEQKYVLKWYLHLNECMMHVL